MPINIFGCYFLACPRVRAKLPARYCSERWRAIYFFNSSLSLLPTTPYYNLYCSNPVTIPTTAIRYSTAPSLKLLPSLTPTNFTTPVHELLRIILIQHFVTFDQDTITLSLTTQLQLATIYPLNYFRILRLRILPKELRNTILSTLPMNPLRKSFCNSMNLTNY